MFEEKESFKHKMAKDLLHGWLSELDKVDGAELHPFRWRKNYGVYKELKFHETDDPFYFECSKGLFDYDKYPEIRDSKEPLEWFDPNYDRGKILFVPDITIFHKGSATILIEVVHKNHVSREKLHRIKNFYSRNGSHLEVYEVDAEEILKQIKVPIKLNCRKLNLESDYSGISSLIETGNPNWKPLKKKEFIETVFSLIRHFSDLDREIYLKECANSLGLSFNALLRDFQKVL